MDTQKYDQISRYLQQQVIPPNLTRTKSNPLLPCVEIFKLKTTTYTRKTKEKKIISLE